MTVTGIVWDDEGMVRVCDGYLVREPWGLVTGAVRDDMVMGKDAGSTKRGGRPLSRRVLWKVGSIDEHRPSILKGSVVFHGLAVFNATNDAS